MPAEHSAPVPQVLPPQHGCPAPPQVLQAPPAQASAVPVHALLAQHG